MSALTPGGIKLNRINGRRVERSGVRTVDGVRVRFHSCKAWRGELWTCDRLGEVWRGTTARALELTPPERWDVCPR